MSFITCIAPKNFLCALKLRLGALVSGTIVIVVLLLCAIAAAATAVTMDRKHVTDDQLRRNAIGYNISSCIHWCMMLGFNLWFIWGVYFKKSSVVLSWVVVMGMWLLQTFCLLVAMMILYRSKVQIVEWIFALLFGLIAIGLLLYGILVGLGYWVYLRDVEKGNMAAPE